MKIRPVCAPVVSIATALLLLAGIRCAQAQEIKIVSPSAYENVEGERSTGPGCCAPYRFQQVFPAEDFAALGNQPHWIVSHTARPDESQISPGAVHFPDIEIRLSTMPVGPPNLNSVFDDNLGADVMQYYRGPMTWAADAASGSGPRKFHHAEFPAGLTPFLYDPSQGNLLLDVITWQGQSGTPRGDKVPGLQTSQYAFYPLIPTEGIRDAASIFQFTFVPMTPGDYNGDGVVDGGDLANWKAGFGTTGNATRSQGDADGDLDVDGADFLVWQTQVGSGPNSTGTAIPEPTALVILVTGVLAIFRRRSNSPRPPVQRVSG